MMVVVALVDARCYKLLHDPYPPSCSQKTPKRPAGAPSPEAPAECGGGFASRSAQVSRGLFGWTHLEVTQDAGGEGSSWDRFKLGLYLFGGREKLVLVYF